MRILYLHQFFVTRAGVGGTRSYEFARRFVARGHGVRMVTAGGGRRTVDGIEVVGVRGGYSDYVSATAVSYPRRMLAFARFALAASAAALRGPRPDVVYATSPPLTMALPALLALAALARAARVRGPRPVAGGPDPDGRPAQPAGAPAGASARALRLPAERPRDRALTRNPRRRDRGRRSRRRRSPSCRTPPTSTCSVPTGPRTGRSRSATSARWARRTT